LQTKFYFLKYTQSTVNETGTERNGDVGI